MRLNHQTNVENTNFKRQTIMQVDQKENSNPNVGQTHQTRDSGYPINQNELSSMSMFGSTSSDTPTGYQMTMRKVTDCSNQSFSSKLLSIGPTQPLSTMLKFFENSNSSQIMDSQSVKREFAMRKNLGCQKEDLGNVFFNEINLKEQQEGYCQAFCQEELLQRESHEFD